MCPAGMRDYEKMTERLAAENADILLSKAVVSGAASNYFTDAVLNDKFIHMYYSEGRRRIVTVTEPLNLRRQLPCEEYSLQGQGTPVSLFQIDLDNSRIDCGMSYLIRLRDGSIFMIDGGYFTHLQGERLFDLMKSVSYGGRVHIAGWFFSHAHQDHFGCFLDFISAHSHDIDIDGLYYNFPSLSLPEAASWKSSDNSSIREFFYDIDLYLPFVPRHILHTGDSFSLHRRPAHNISRRYTDRLMQKARSHVWKGPIRRHSAGVASRIQRSDNGDIRAHISFNCSLANARLRL